MAIGVMKARKRFGVEFPDLYAKESNPNKAAFDAVQRGHQNVLENIPIFLAVQAFVALAAGPLVAAGLIEYVPFPDALRGRADHRLYRGQGAAGFLFFPPRGVLEGFFFFEERKKKEAWSPSSLAAPLFSLSSGKRATSRSSCARC